MKKMKTWIAGILVCGSLFFGCAAADEGSSKDADKTAETVSEKQEDVAQIPYLIVDKDYNVVGTNHFENVQVINLSIDDIFHLGANYSEPGWGDSDQKRSYKIVSDAFKNCPKLKQIIFSAQSNVSEVAEDAFKGCAEDLTVYCEKESELWKRLQQMGISVSDVSLLEDAKEETIYLMDRENTLLGFFTNEFNDGNSDKSDVTMHLPDETKKTADSCFAHTYAMGAEIVIPEGVEEVGENAFSTSEFGKITFLGNKIKTIRKGTFIVNNSCIKKLEIPEGVENIEEKVFEATHMEELVIPETVKTVKDENIALFADKLIVRGKDTKFREDTLSDQKEWTDDVEKAEVHCYKGSEAEKYFKELGCKIVYLN